MKAFTVYIIVILASVSLVRTLTVDKFERTIQERNDYYEQLLNDT